MILGTRDQYQAAITRAQKAGLPAKIREIAGSPGVYAVPSSTGAIYLVRATAQDILCPCPAGSGQYQRGGERRPCTHAAGVWLRQVGRRATRTTTQYLDELPDDDESESEAVG